MYINTDIIIKNISIKLKYRNVKKGEMVYNDRIQRQSSTFTIHVLALNIDIFDYVHILTVIRSFII